MFLINICSLLHTHPSFYYQSAPSQQRPRVLQRAVTSLSRSPATAYTPTQDRDKGLHDLGPRAGEILGGRAELERMLDRDLPWLTWYLLSSHPHPTRGRGLCVCAEEGKWAHRISSRLSGVSPPPHSSESCSSLPPCFQEPRNGNPLVSEPCNSQPPSRCPLGSREQFRANVLRDHSPAGGQEG